MRRGGGDAGETPAVRGKESLLGGEGASGESLEDMGTGPRIPRAPSLPGEDAAMGLGRLCFGGGVVVVVVMELHLSLVSGKL